MLDVQFVIEELPGGRAIDVQEDRGSVVFRIDPHLEPEEIARFLTEAAASVLAGGHWFQEWKGDIISADPTCGGATRPIPYQRLMRHHEPQPESDAA